MRTQLTWSFLMFAACNGGADDTACTATFDPAGTVPIEFNTWDPADPCGTLQRVTEEHDAAYWGEWWRHLECGGARADDMHNFTDATGRCVEFFFSTDWDAFEDPWLIGFEGEHPCRHSPSCE